MHVALLMIVPRQGQAGYPYNENRDGKRRIYRQRLPHIHTPQDKLRDCRRHPAYLQRGGHHHQTASHTKSSRAKSSNCSHQQENCPQGKHSS